MSCPAHTDETSVPYYREPRDRLPASCCACLYLPTHVHKYYHWTPAEDAE